MKMIELKNKIEKAEIVSFDIFDTLIVRMYRKPTDLFKHMEESLDIIGFQQARIDAEMALRNEHPDIHEITLDQIYENMHPSYHVYKKHEIELEKIVCKANPEMAEVFEYAKKSGKRIIISSDMYLPKNVIEEILENNGYRGYEKLFLSSDTLRPKATGEMYEDVISYTNVNPKEILHIGDNEYTDYEIALNCGIEAYCYAPIKETYGNNYNAAFFAGLEKSDDMAASIAEGLVTLNAVKNCSQDYWENFAYKYAGLLMVGYCKWLKKQMDKEGIKKAYFMLRDGYIVKKVFDYLYPEFETYEIYGFRRLFFFAQMEKAEDILEYVTLQTEGMTYKEIYDRLQINESVLYKQYCQRFPEQDKLAGDRNEIQEFVKNNFSYFEKIKEEENAIILEYLENINLFEEKAAIVDLGWRASMLKGVQSIAKKAQKNVNLYGYYLGTHAFKNTGLRIEEYALKKGQPKEEDNPISCMNSQYIIDVLELIFSADRPSVLKLEKVEEKIVPIQQMVSIYERERQEISKKIQNGIMSFAKDFTLIDNKYPIEVAPEVALLGMKYLEVDASPRDKAQIMSVFAFHGMGDDTTGIPIFPNFMGRIGIINPWPGAVSAESELTLRIKRGIENIGVSAVCLDNYGHVLDANLNVTEERVTGKDVDFIITTHYETHKAIDTFYYHALWNPPEIPLNQANYLSNVANNYLMNDDYLIHNEGVMQSHLKSLLLNKHRTTEGASALTTSFPASAILEPKLENPVMFYCGMNWEVLLQGCNRHEGLFKLLDDTNKVKFFGPEIVESWGGIRPWEGYRCYQYEIPFDGFSILHEINECGVCLALSSDIHRRSSMVTNRVYEACTAGAVIISDENSFMLKHFKDAALFIDYNKNNPKDTFDQIMEKYNWIVNHKEEALKMAKRAQKIFVEQFALEVQIRKLIENHRNRFKQIACDIFAKDDSKKVLVTYVLNTLNKEQIAFYLSAVMDNVKNQLYGNIELAIAVDRRIYADVAKYCRTYCASAKAISMDLFDKKGSRALTDGQAICQMLQKSSFDYFVNTNKEEIWFYDHITTLVRTIEDEECACAYSGSLFQDGIGNRIVSFFDIASRYHIYDAMDNSAAYPMPGQFMFTKEAKNKVPDFVFDALDGKEHYAMVNILRYKYTLSVGFSRRMTFAFTNVGADTRNQILSDDKQTRFIRDLVRFYLPDGRVEMVREGENVIAGVHGQIGGISKNMLASTFQTFPIKAWIKIRYYQAKLRKIKTGTKKEQKYAKKMQEAMAFYNQYFGI